MVSFAIGIHVVESAEKLGFLVISKKILSGQLGEIRAQLDKKLEGEALVTYEEDILVWNGGG